MTGHFCAMPSLMPVKLAQTNAMNAWTNECTTDGNDVKAKKKVKALESASAAEPDENDHNEHVQPQIEAKGPSKNKVVPFFRPKVPRSQV